MSIRWAETDDTGGGERACLVLASASGDLRRMSPVGTPLDLLRYQLRWLLVLSLFVELMVALVVWCCYFYRCRPSLLNVFFFRRTTHVR